MTDDLIAATFADLDAYYPNSRIKRKVIEPKPPEISPNPTWDSRPYKKILPNGKAVEMFTIGAVAAAMGRPVITIRVWENEGYLPASPYRLPAKKNAKGEDQKGRRLYSRSMVEKLIELFDSAGLLHVKRVEWSLHRQLSIEIAEAWSKIRADETNANQ